jgi:GTP-binding protein
MGMIIGIHTRDNDLEVNVLKGKQLTNIRSAGKDEAVKLTPPIRMTLDRALSWIQDDELVEVTPKSIRLRKRSSIRTTASASARRGACRSSAEDAFFRRPRARI